MKLERVRPGVFNVTLHAFEMSSLIAAARLVAQDSKTELPGEAVEQLRSLLTAYDAEVRRVNESAPDGPALQ